MNRIGILIVNLGSPRSPTIPAIRSFLKEFLSDPYVLDMPAWQRWMLVNLVIAPFRPKTIVNKYRSIWTKLGSPLMVHTYNFRQRLEEKLKLLSGYDFTVDVGMRYGAPSIEQALQAMAEKSIKKVIVLQLYPHEAFSTTFSNMDYIAKVAQTYNLDVTYVPPFYNEPGFIENLADVTRETVAGQKVDHYIMSYHGVPVSQLQKQSGKPNCGQPNCCQEDKMCYKAQCEETSRLLAERLNLNADQYSISYQSRLSQNWVKPFTDDLVQELPKKGLKNIAIISPSFVIDCLETLQELKIQERDRFMSSGGFTYTYIPCLNDRNSWVNTAFGYVSKALKN